MELKDATNFSLLKEYIYERNHQLHYFENLIIQDCLKYYSEPQVFFVIKREGFDFPVSWLQEQYKEHLVNYSSFMDIIRTNDFDDFWICKSEESYQEIKEYKNGKEIIRWESYQKDCWNSFPSGFVSENEYKILFEDSYVKIVVFYKRLKLRQDRAKEKNIMQFSYQKSLEKAWDIYYKEEDAIFYSFLDNSETMKYLGITEYFRWLRSYEKQENSLKRELLKSKY